MIVIVIRCTPIPSTEKSQGVFPSFFRVLHAHETLSNQQSVDLPFHPLHALVPAKDVTSISGKKTGNTLNTTGGFAATR